MSGLSKPVAFDHIPIVDISGLLSDDEAAKRRVAAEMAKAASEVGFLYVTGHGIPDDMIDRLCAQAAAFFALPVEAKQQYYIGKSRAHRGYVPVGEENFYSGDIAKVDKKEAYDLSIEVSEDDPDYKRGYRFLGPNQWPVEVPGFQEDVYGYYEAAMDLGAKLFGGFARALGLDEDYFAPLISKPPSQLRMVHYPEGFSSFTGEAGKTQKSEWGISPHTDYECFTILHTTAPGLEVLNSAGEWIDAPPIPGAFVINIGDMLEVMTNGRFIATSHRVRDVAEERYSFPLFCSLDYDTVVEPLPEFREAGSQEYPRYVAGDHLLAETMKSFVYLRDLEKAGVLAVPASEIAAGHSFGRR